MHNIEYLDEGSGIAITLQRHEAVYHKDCRTRCNSQKVKRHGGSTVPVPAVTGANKMATPPRPVVDEDDCE